MSKPAHGSVQKTYEQTSVKKRIEQFLIDNVGKIVTTDMIKQVAGKNRKGNVAENWHQRLSELRVNDGYTILSDKDRDYLSVGEYLLEDLNKRAVSNKRVYPAPATWKLVLERADHKCEWSEEGKKCGLKAGDIDDVGGGTVKLTADHKTPHSSHAIADPNNPDDWQVLCGRHQVTKKNFWDSKTGKLNIEAIVQAASKSEKKKALILLLEFFNLDRSIASDIN